MPTPVCFIDANDLKSGMPETNKPKKVLGWTATNDTPNFGSCVVINGRYMVVSNWYMVCQTVAELKEGEGIPTPYMEVLVIDVGEAQKRQMLAARAQAGVGLVGMAGDAGALNGKFKLG